MADSAKGPVAGYLYQFEKALVLLADLNNVGDSITIEEVDDVAIHNEEGVVIMTVQAKHSISPSGTTFEDTSYSLWRTLEIWIQKIKAGIFSEDTEFICSTNKKIPVTSLLTKINTDQLSDVIITIESLLKTQEGKLADAIAKDPKSGGSIKQTIKFIKYILQNPKEFELIKNNLKIEDEDDIKELFLTKVHMMSDLKTGLQRDNLYEAFYGWIMHNSIAKWRNAKIARFTKKDFDDKMANINSTPSILNAIFRTKQALGSISDDDLNKKRKELFVKQIEDIDRNENAKERKIKEAIQDFIYSDIEISYIITIGNYTKKDFEDFLDECFDKWQECHDNCVIKNIDEYNEEEKNTLAVTIFDKIMSEIEIKFKEDFAFTTGNKYIKNGSFLRLSNIPSIGWHPEWEKKYSINS
jgi:hypothetical protein